jgi:hypothetical protein
VKRLPWPLALLLPGSILEMLWRLLTELLWAPFSEAASL